MADVSFLYFVISGLILMVLPLLLLAATWFRGFFFAVLKVKASGGAKVLVRAWNVTHFLFKTGVIREGYLVFTVNKQTLRFQVDTLDFYRMLRMNCIDVDITSGVVRRRLGEVGTPYDAATADNIYRRCLLKPTIQDNKTIIILVMLALVLILCLINAGVSYQLYKMLQAISPTIAQAAIF